MAKASKKSVVVKPAVKEVREDVITLELTRDEAIYLRDITGHIVIGSGPARAINDEIYSAVVSIVAYHKAVIPNCKATLSVSENVKGDYEHLQDAKREIVALKEELGKVKSKLAQVEAAQVAITNPLIDLSTESVASTVALLRSTGSLGVMGPVFGALSNELKRRGFPTSVSSWDFEKGDYTRPNIDGTMFHPSRLIDQTAYYEQGRPAFPNKLFPNWRTPKNPWEA